MAQENQFKQRLEEQILKEDDFPRDVKVLALQINDTTGSINANTFVPLVLFNREEVLQDIDKFKRQLEKMGEII